MPINKACQAGQTHHLSTVHPTDVKDEYTFVNTLFDKASQAFAMMGQALIIIAWQFIRSGPITRFTYGVGICALYADIIEDISFGHLPQIIYSG